MANGFQALKNNTTGDGNTANGEGALQFNTTGNGNAANGEWALHDNTTGRFNTATGFFALESNTTGFVNTADGGAALDSNTTGSFNTAVGVNALNLNTTGSNNTAIGGFNALFYNTTGNNNIAVGFQAGINLTTGNNNIDVGNAGVAGESNTIRIGNGGTQTKTFVAGINGAAVTGSAVKINAAGQMGTAPSSSRFKDQIKPMDKASEAILALKPVTFHYKKELDPNNTPQFGLIAEEVEKANPDLVDRDSHGKVYTVRYDAVNAMLLNEFLKEHRKVEELEATVAQQQKESQSIAAQQQKEIKALTASLKEQASQIQKVSAQLEVSKPAPQTVLNDQ